MSEDRIVTQDLGDWVVRMEWPVGVEHGGPGALLISPADPETYPVGGLSSTVLRDIDFRAALETLRRQLEGSRRWSKGRERYEADRAERLKTALAQGVTDEYLALLASAYVSAANRGQAKPLEYLAEMVGKTPSTVKGHLWQARKKELLSGSAGRAGGQLTDKATKILERIVPAAPRGLV
ncbi:hypothetical protein [Nocardia crassostreae]|uniref:hypothetical protein n=1 Tax=Nocardia crassostreae TaxID=53428 RepID=UPI001FE125C0|nr:hypothetical protein [Nocardia crassostreae]